MAHNDGLWPAGLGCLAGLTLAACAGEPSATIQPAAQPVTAPDLSGAPGAEPLDWERLEASMLSGHLELTSRDQFVKSGEAYFSPDGSWIIFQAVPVPEEGHEPDPVYSMYVARLFLNERGEVTGIEPPIQISPSGSANTCGWFHPANDGRVIFGSTLERPSHLDAPGFKVGTNKYMWSFPEEMEVVSRTLAPVVAADRGFAISGAKRTLERMKQEQQEMDRLVAAAEKSGDPEKIKWTRRMAEAKRENNRDQEPRIREFLERIEASDPAKAPDAERAAAVFSRPEYDAECTYSPDGRFILYSHVESRNPDGGADADIWVYDMTTGIQRVLVKAPGYDGGPFFSPDGKYICYRSDRRGDNLLQVYIAKLRWDDFRVPVGIEWERPVTDDQNVNWCPFWHPSGRYLLYATSAVGHFNYEVFAASIDDAFLSGGTAPQDVKRVRVTYANGADVLPVFSPDGKWMMWTAQRGPTAEGESKPSSQVWIARVAPGMSPEALFGGGERASSP